MTFVEKLELLWLLNMYWGVQKLIVEKGLDIGFAYDGDANHFLCVDEKDNIITGEHILYIYGPLYE